MFSTHITSFLVFFVLRTALLDFSVTLINRVFFWGSPWGGLFEWFLYLFWLFTIESRKTRSNWLWEIWRAFSWILHTSKERFVIEVTNCAIMLWRCRTRAVYCFGWVLIKVSRIELIHYRVRLCLIQILFHHSTSCRSLWWLWSLIIKLLLLICILAIHHSSCWC